MSKSKSLYLEVADTLLERIEDNTYLENQLIPSDYKLARELDVSRLTVRKAIDYLVKEKKLIKEPGVGAYVIQVEQERIQSGRGGLQSFTEAAKHYGLNVTTNLLSFTSNLPSTPILEKHFQLSDSTQNFHHMRRIRFGNQEPMTMEDIYINAKYAPLLNAVDCENSIYTLLEETIQIAYSHQDIEAVLATKEQSALLNTEIGMPLFRITSTAHAINGETIMYDVSYYRADMYTIKETLYRDIE